MLRFIKYFILTFLLIFLLTPKIVLAEDQFIVDATVTYKVSDAGETMVTHEVVLENLFSSIYATTYTLALDNISAQNIEAREDTGSVIPFEIKEENSRTNIKLTFNEPVVGLGAKRHFYISYKNSNFAVKTGEVWEISIPKLGDTSSFRNYNINLEVPDALGKEAYISPLPQSQKDENGIQYFSFAKKAISETGVTAGFGEFQVFNFNLSYHLENPLTVSSQTEIALPPDTAFQKVYYSKIEPKPNSVYVDEDGNYIAVYKLFARQRLDINTEGSVQIFAGYRTFPRPTDISLSANLTPTNYWQSTDTEIKALAQKLKTPQEIYNYVAGNLKYNLGRVQPNTTRMGAIGALRSPTEAICMEFTDLFVAISRAAGIPAREINGFAYTENKELQPLSLVADVLHAWPEYYDTSKGIWVPIDPTWGSTSGVDYFNKLDLRHFTFVIHGASDKEPYPPGSYKLGPNPQKDVFVSFGQLPMNSTSNPQISLKIVRQIPFLDTVYQYTIKNPGPATMYNFFPSVYFDNNLHSRVQVAILPPYGNVTNEFKLPYSILGKNMPDNLKVTVLESELIEPTNKSQVIINSLLMLFALFILVMLLVLVKLKKIKLDKITDTIARIYAKVFRKSTQGPNNT